MKKNLVAFLALALTAWLTPSGWAESHYQGKPADHWVKLLGHAEAGQRLTAIHALGQIGPEKPEIVAAVTAAVTDKDANVRQAAVVALGRVGTVEQLTALVNGKELTLRQAALQALGELAAKDENAVKVLVKALQGRNLREAAAVALGNMKTIYAWQAIQALSKAAHDKDEDGQFRLTAAEAAGKLVTCNRVFSAYSVYTEVLKDQNPEIRVRALRLLCAKDGKVLVSEEFLLALLADKHPAVRQQAAAALRGTGAAAVPGLTKLLTHEQPETRREAAVLLGQLKEKAKTAVHTLTEALNDKDESVRFQAAVAVWHIDRQAEPLLPLLIAGLQAKDVKTKNLDRRDEVLTLLQQMGPQAKTAIPVLVPMLIDAATKNARGYDCRLIEDVLVACGKEATPALVEALKHENPKVRGRIAQVFLEMNQTPQEAVPALIEAMKGVTERRELARAVQGAGSAAIPLLQQALRHEDAGVRKEVVTILGQLLPKNQPVPQGIFQAMRDADADVRRAAVNVLGLGFVGLAKSRSALPELLEALKDPQIRIAAANTLAAFGPEAMVESKTVVPALKAAALQAVSFRCPQESAYLFQFAATRAIFRIERDATPLLSTTWDLTFRSPAICQEAEALLVEIGPAVVPFLKTELRSGTATAQTRLRAATLLGRINLGSHVVAAEFAKALEDRDPSVRLAAAAGLARLGDKAKEAAPLLIAALKDQSPPVRIAALQAIQSQGATKEAIPALTEALQSTELRSIAILALGRLGADAKAAVPTLQALLNDQDFTLRVNAAEAIWKITGESKDVAPALCLVLAENNQVAIQAAARILAEMGADAKSCIPFLVEALQHERVICRCRKTSQDEVRTLVVSALSNHGPEAVPYLVAALAHDKPQVRAGAFEALTRMGMQARAAVPALTEALRDGDASYRAAAASTLKAIDPAAAASAGVK